MVPETGGATTSSRISAADYLCVAESATGPNGVAYGDHLAGHQSSPFPGTAVPSQKPVIPSSQSWDNGGGWAATSEVGDGAWWLLHAEHHYGP